MELRAEAMYNLAYTLTNFKSEKNIYVHANFLQVLWEQKIPCAASCRRCSIRNCGVEERASPPILPCYRAPPAEAGDAHQVGAGCARAPAGLCSVWRRQTTYPFPGQHPGEALYSVFMREHECNIMPSSLSYQRSLLPISFLSFLCILSPQILGVRWVYVWLICFMCMRILSHDWE